LCLCVFVVISKCFGDVVGIPEHTLFDDFFDAADDSVIEHHFDAVWMSRRLGKNSLDDPFRQLSGALILFFNDTDFHARLNLRSCLAIHS
jgi:hypothetical protein